MFQQRQQQHQQQQQDEHQQRDSKIIAGRSDKQTVPTRMFGLWERRYIRFLEGGNAVHGIEEASIPQYGDRQSHVRVMWLQTPSGFGDMRIPKSRFCPMIVHDQNDHDNETPNDTVPSLTDLDVSQLLQLAEAECFCGTCSLDETSNDGGGVHADDHQERYRAKWVDGDTRFSQQVLSIWPEDGWLEWPEEATASRSTATGITDSSHDNDEKNDDRICMMEYAPEGQYVEDWRLLPDSLGMCCHLTSTITTTTTNDEKDSNDDEKRRGRSITSSSSSSSSSNSIVRNIYMAGEHLMLAVDRPRRGRYGPDNDRTARHDDQDREGEKEEEEEEEEEEEDQRLLADIVKDEYADNRPLVEYYLCLRNSRMLNERKPKRVIPTMVLSYPHFRGDKVRRLLWIGSMMRYRTTSTKLPQPLCRSNCVERREL